MDKLLILAKSDGIVIYRKTGDGWQPDIRGLEGHHATSVIAREGVILAGTRRGIYRSDDLGASWQEASAGLEHLLVRWMAYHPDISDLEFAGSEPAGIFVSRDGARSWRACREVSKLRDKHGWYLPYSSGAGCVRGFAFHGSRVYAAVEVGGVLVSQDNGETWSLAGGSTGDPQRVPAGNIHPDVHSIVIHPSSPDIVYAPTGGGFYASQDGGQTWEMLYDCYCRAVWADPEDANHLLLGPADGVDRNGRIEESRDAGRTWQPASRQLDTPWRRHMVERFYQHQGTLFAVLSNGDLLSARLDDLAWEPVSTEGGTVHALAFMKA